MSSVTSTTSLTDFINLLDSDPESVSFEQVMQVIVENYKYTPATFTNGDAVNEAGTNEGSCKIFYFAKLNELTEQQTLACFAQYYREDVLNHPEGNDHGNIRNFMQTGWDKVEFNSVALTPLS
ncbi:HopJ type III effector protein [Colwellia echini]|uniref:HopJ type III effector protein n=1 Tax=Colwellia echini TaxID=1982103 RepID=A0ABY3MYI8_9GAMM|nr:HopJ type III effector protein [Colwellia echini]TYK66300.1 HopJ type III effector protein [Colwellia echini]